MPVVRCLLPTLSTAIALSGLTFVPLQALAQQVCTQTLQPGMSVASAVSGAASGSTICLASGSYGTASLSNVTKNPRVTLVSVTGQGASMKLTFSGANGITVDSVTVTSADFLGSTTKNITVKNSKFTGRVVIDDLTNSNVLLTNNTHNNINGGGQYVSPARIQLPYSSSTHSGVTIQNSVLSGGSADGVQTGVGVNIIGNEFTNIYEGSCGDCHTDAIQLLGDNGTVIRGNYIHDVATGIVAFDGVSNAIIEHNIVDTGGRPWGIELYADNGSIVRHNTLLYRATCLWNMPCGTIDLNRKSVDPAGRGTIVVDNIATSITTSNGSTYAQRSKNLVRNGAVAGDISGAPTYVGGATPTTQAGFTLASNSLGKDAALSPAGSDIGAEISTQSAQTPEAPSNLRIEP